MDEESARAAARERNEQLELAEQRKRDRAEQDKRALGPLSDEFERLNVGDVKYNGDVFSDAYGDGAPEQQSSTQRGQDAIDRMESEKAERQRVAHEQLYQSASVQPAGSSQRLEHGIAPRLKPKPSGTTAAASGSRGPAPPLLTVKVDVVNAERARAHAVKLAELVPGGLRAKSGKIRHSHTTKDEQEENLAKLDALVARVKRQMRAKELAASLLTRADAALSADARNLSAETRTQLAEFKSEDLANAVPDDTNFADAVNRLRTRLAAFNETL